MMGNSPEVSMNFNRLFLKLNPFISSVTNHQLSPDSVKEQLGGSWHWVDEVS